MLLNGWITLDWQSTIMGSYASATPSYAADLATWGSVGASFANIEKGWVDGAWDASKVGNYNWGDHGKRTAVSTEHTPLVHQVVQKSSRAMVHSDIYVRKERNPINFISDILLKQILKYLLQNGSSSEQL